MTFTLPTINVAWKPGWHARVVEQVTLLPSLVPPAYRAALEALLARPTAHERIDRQFTPPYSASRWTDGSFPAFYAAKEVVTALYEKLHHDAAYLIKHNIGSHPHAIELLRVDIAAVLEDVRALMSADPSLTSSTAYGPCQALGVSRVANGANGLLYTSVRDSVGVCAAVFRKPVVSNPQVYKSVSIPWDGSAFPPSPPSP